MRKFYLENSAGERKPLNAEDGVFLSAPAGLGFTLATSYADLKRGFFQAVADDSEPQSSFTGTLTFYKSEPYRQWKSFVDWCALAGQLVLVYKPFNSVEYYRQVDIAYLTKGELNAVGALDVPASFSCLTPWYEKSPSVLDMQNNEGKAIRYTYRYTDDLIYGADSSATLAGTIYPGGHVPGSVQLRYTGAILNPQIRLVGNVSGKTHGLTALTASFQQTDTLELSTQYRDSHVHKIAADGTVTDLLDSVSLSTDPFWHIPIDEPCTISVEADSVFSGNAELLVFYYYRSV